MEDLIFESDGPRLAASNYWGSSYDLAGYLFVSLNAGAFRVLVPSGGLPGGKIRDLKCKRVVVSRGRWPAQRRDDAVELLFDDGSDSPFALHLGLQQFDRLPAPEDEGRDDFRCLVYTGGAGLPPRLRHDLPAAYRRVRSIPDLSPWRSRPC